MILYLEERADGGFGFYIDGDFQFDTADEGLYHEGLALPALCLTRPETPQGLRVLICGGGDGLALRECLRFPGIAQVDLVDYDDQVVELGRTRFAEINAHAFADPRVSVHIQDAWEFLEAPGRYDAILCDFTVPRRPEDTRIFSREWYLRLQEALAPDGMIGLNAFSPQITPEAFWCLHKTVRSSGLSPLPYHVCIPSFRAHGYGAWAFLLASRRPLTQPLLHNLACPVPARQIDLTRLWRGARFARRERAIQHRVSIHTLSQPCLLPLLLNPGSSYQRAGSQEEIDPNLSPYDLNPLLNAIPITHPYHTRVMVETLAREVVGTVRGLDIRRLLDALLQRTAALPRDMCRELGRLRDFLRTYTPRFELFSAWSYRLFACLVLMMTLANAIAPDNAFAKGSFGGHGSFSAHGSFGGHSGFSGHGSFAAHGGEMGGRVSSSSFGESFGGGGGGRSTSSSFGHDGASTGSFGRGSVNSGSIARSVSTPRITGSGFRSGFGRDVTVDIYGVREPAHYYSYCGSGFGHYHSYTIVNGGSHPATPPETHRSLFVAADDLIVLDNGDVVVTLSDNAYLLLSNGTVALMSNASSDPLLLLYPDPNLLQNVADQLRRQQAAAQLAIQVRRDWLSWVGWTAALLPTVSQDRMERDNLENLTNRLATALQRLGGPPSGAQPTRPGTGQTEMFIGCMLMPDGTVSLRGADGNWVNTDGNQLTATGGASKPRPCPPLLASTLRSILLKMRQDRQGGISSDQNDLSQLSYDRSSLQNDMSQYQSLEEINGPSYDVDYGTDEISASDAITRTQADLDQNARDQQQVQQDIARLQTELNKIHTALEQFPAGK